MNNSKAIARIRNVITEIIGVAVIFTVIIFTL